MKTDTKQPKRRSPIKSAHAQVVPKPNSKASPAERRMFCALVATDMNPKQAYATIRPHTSPSGADGYGYAWAREMAAEIAALKATAAQAAALAHGVNASYLIGHAKAILETPISALGPDNIYCKKYRITETMTDAGPKTTIEVEKDSPLSAVQAMAKMTGLEGQPVGQAAEGQGQGGQPTVRDLIASLIKPGSPIARRLAGGVE